MNVLLLTIDSLRAFGGRGANTPFMDKLRDWTTHFEHVYASECWTLPSRTSMFTGLLHLNTGHISRQCDPEINGATKQEG